MCAIVGILNSPGRPASPSIMKNMLTAIAHRGPDDEGIYVNENLSLGHRRLAVIDLSALGHQPMSTKDGRFILSYNGEIYNFNEIRLELTSLGHIFHSKTDTEVILNAFAQWGVQSIPRLNGVFTFAIWDKQKKELFLARDRYGARPLYYAHAQGSFIFASEIKALLAHPDFRRDLDREGLVEYFTFQNFFTDKTLFKNVSTFPPGHYAVVKEGDKAPRFTQFWDFNFGNVDTAWRSEESYAEELDFLLRQAINRQLVSDVEVGAYLSGGMDSGSLAALAAPQLPYMKTFTIGFDLNSASGLELSFDEREKAEHMSYLFQTEHYEMVLKAGDMERCLPTLVRHLEEPRVGQSYPNFYAAKLASKFCKVVLSGAGSDEIFGGYPWRYYRSVGSTNFEDFIDRYYQYWQRIVPQSLVGKMFAPIASDIKHVSTRDIFRSVFKNIPSKLNQGQDYVHQSMYLEAKTFLHGLLIVEDKLSMAHGMETRVPFLDNDLVDFVQKLPLQYKISNLENVTKINENDLGAKHLSHFQKSSDGKNLLRKVMARYLPANITTREKQGFSAPDASWFKGESMAYVKNLILKDTALIYQFMDRETVFKMVGQHLDGVENRRLLIWSLLSFENWLKQFS